MRILVLNPYGSEPGYSGPRVLLERLFAAIPADEHGVTLVTTGRSKATDDSAEWAETTVRLVDSTSLGRMDQMRWALAAGCWVLLHARRFDVVHVHGCYLFNVVPAAAALLRRTPYALFPLTTNGDLSGAVRRSPLGAVSALRRLLVRRAAVGYALSESISEELVRSGMRHDRVVAIPNLVDVDDFRPPSGPDHRAELRTIGFAGKVGRRKGADIVLSALAELRRRGWRASAVFVGPFESPAYKQEFEARLHEEDLAEVVSVTDYVDQVAPHLRKLSVFTLPSAQEGLPGALVEAMASGLPCVVTDVGGMADVVRRADAGAVIERSAAELAGAVHALWEHPASWRSCSTGGRAYAVEHFRSEAVMERYLDGLTGVHGRTPVRVG